MWGVSVFIFVLAAFHIVVHGAQPDSDGAAARCKDVKKLFGSKDSILVDLDALADVEGDIQRILDCVPHGAAVQLDVPEMDLGGTLQIGGAVSVKGLPTSIRCTDVNTRPVIDIRSNNVLLAGFSFIGCNLSSSSGVIKVKGSQNVTFMDMAFKNNANTGGSACVSAIESIIHMHNITASNNTGKHGGAMSFSKASGVTIADSLFENNRATEQGGAVHIHDSNCSVSDSTFIENHAFDDGGAIFAEGELESHVNLKDANFFGNQANGEYKKDGNWRTGGGIALRGPKLRAEIQRAAFANNSAMHDGGAIYALNGITMFIQDSDFTENSANQGGALYTKGTLPNVTSLELDTCRLTSNRAYRSFATFPPLGGALTMFGNGTEAKFKDCTFLENESEVDGGAVYAKGTTKLKIAGSKFSGNSAGNVNPSEANENTGVTTEANPELTFGGGLFLLKVVEVAVVDSNFTKNVGERGGGLVINNEGLERSIVNVTGCIFEENVARGDSILADGGALAVVGVGSHCTIKRSIFRGNEATYEGGAIFFIDISSLHLEKTSFTDNFCEATVLHRPSKETFKGTTRISLTQGGAMYAWSIPSIFITESNFTHNHAERGGAFLVHGGGLEEPIMNITDSVFEGNMARGNLSFSDGGAMALFGENLQCTMHKSVLKENKAETEGGAIFCLKIASMSLERCSLLRNSCGVDVSKTKSGLPYDSSLDRFSFGGGLALELVYNTSIVDTDFIENHALAGGGIFANTDELKMAALNIMGSNFEENTATGHVSLSNGGALAMVGKRLACSIKKSIFKKNKAVREGGAFFFSEASYFNSKTFLTIRDDCLADPFRRQTDSSPESSLDIRDAVGGTKSARVIPQVFILQSDFLVNNASRGGGIFVQGNANSTLIECTFNMNRADRSGGAVHAENWLRSLLERDGLQIRMIALDFLENKAGNIGEDLLIRSLGGEGGALKLSGPGVIADVSDSSFWRNVGGTGGAIHLEEVHRAQITNSSISSSRAASSGGGLAAFDIGHLLHLMRVSFSENSARWGGGVSAKATKNTELLDVHKIRFSEVKFRRNTATRGGAGLEVGGMQLQCAYCSFIENIAGNRGSREAGDGGGIMATSFSLITLKDSIVKGCSAGRSGGGVYIQDAAVKGVNLTVSGNTAGENGGGIAASFISSFAPTGDVPLFWSYTSSSIDDNRSKVGGGVHVFTRIESAKDCGVLGDDTSLVVSEQEHLKLLDCRLTASFFRVLADKRGNTSHPLLIIDTTVDRNVAEVSGSGVFANDISIVRMCCKKECLDGVDFKYAPNNCQAMDRGKQARFVPVGSLTNSVALSHPEIYGHQSEKALPSIEVKVLDAFGQIAPQNVTLRMQSTAPEMELYGNPVTRDGILVSGIFNATGVIVRALPGTYTVTFELTPGEAESSSIRENMTVVVRECEVGEIPKHGGKRCELCGEDSFSFDPSDTKCQPCPLERAECAGAILVPKQGFWHANPHATQLHPCMASEGCTYPNRTSALEEGSRKFTKGNVAHNSMAFYPQCAQGYKDVLCGSCQHSHGKVRSQKCMECRGRAPAIVFLTLVVLVLVILSFIFMRSAVSYSREISSSSKGNLSTQPHIRVGFNLEAFLAGRSPGPEDAPQQPSSSSVPKRGRVSDVFKILVNFLQVTGSAAAIKVDWSKSMLASLVTFGLMSGATSHGFFASECAFWVNELPRSIKATILFVFLPGVVWAIFSILYFLSSAKKENPFQYFRLRSFTTLLAVIHASYVSVTTEVVRIFYCVKAEPLDGLFWAEDTSVVCYRSSHGHLAAFVGIPLLIVVTFGFPGTLLFILMRNKDNLTDPSMAKRYGFFYRSYRKDTVIWEVVILARKALVSTIVVFGHPLGGGLQGDLALVVLFTSTILQVHFQPFEDPKLNKMELASLVLSSVAFMIGNMANRAAVSGDANIGMSIFFIIAVGGYFLYMVRQFFKAGMRGVERWAREDRLLDAKESSSVQVIKTVPPLLLGAWKKKTNLLREKAVNTFSSIRTTIEES